jgi:hypothetical protein
MGLAQIHKVPFSPLSYECGLVTVVRYIGVTSWALFSCSFLSASSSGEGQSSYLLGERYAQRRDWTPVVRDPPIDYTLRSDHHRLWGGTCVCVCENVPRAYHPTL